MATNDQFQLVTFKLGAELYGVNIMDVKEIVKIQNVRVIPNAPYYVEIIVICQIYLDGISIDHFIILICLNPA